MGGSHSIASADHRVLSSLHVDFQMDVKHHLKPGLGICACDDCRLFNYAVALRLYRTGDDSVPFCNALRIPGAWSEIKQLVAASIDLLDIVRIGNRRQIKWRLSISSNYLPRLLILQNKTN